MSETAVDDMVALLPPLLESLDALTFIARYFNPLEFDATMDAAGSPDAALRAARLNLRSWPEQLGDVRDLLERTCDAALAAFDGLRAAPGDPDGLSAVFRALRYGPRAHEALYPLAAKLPPVSAFFLDPATRGDAALQARLAAPAHDDTGVIHFDNERRSRGGFSLYVPEYYTPDRTWPLVMALHGGGGHGRVFLWSWLREARSHGAIVIAPTSIGSTWALMGADSDTPNLNDILAYVQSRWAIDPTRLLMTGMSDGGTFCYVSGLEPGSPFTHLGPVAASFHPMLAQMAVPARITGLPIYLTHGRLDWMFAVELAQQARDALSAAGARVIYREIDDLSHAYPREINPDLLAWLREPN